MNDQFVVLSSLAMDLKRVDSHIVNILEDIKTNKDAEDLLMYSTLIQNYVRKNE